MKEKKTAKDNNNYSLNNSAKQSTMENYKLTTTHNVFHNAITSSGHNMQRKEDRSKQRVIGSSPKKMPDYHKMSIPELKVAVAKYGIKPLSKAVMIHQLVLIWDYLHKNNYLEDESPLKENAVNDAENILRSKDVLSNNIGYIKEFPELSDKTKQKIKDHIIAKYYERIIRYEQLEFDDIYKEIVDQGILCTDRQLQHYLDVLNIQNKSLKRTDEWKKDHKKCRKI